MIKKASIFTHKTSTKLCVVNRYEPLFLKKEEKKWYNSDVSLETEPWAE